MTNNESQSTQNPFPIHRPDWNYWKSCKSVRLWHAVALACDLDPYQYANTENSQLDRLFSQPGRKFDELLMRAMSNAGNSGIIKVISFGDAGMEESEISSSTFGAWLKSVNQKVPTDFPWQDEAVQPLTREWPWGTYETKLLLDLAEAANKFWRNYTPSEIDTAPTNDEVEEWLSKRGVSQNMAKAMATILRADKLRTGPR